MTSACCDSSRRSVRALLSWRSWSMSCCPPTRPEVFSVSSFFSFTKSTQLNTAVFLCVGQKQLWLRSWCVMTNHKYFLNLFTSSWLHTNNWTYASSDVSIAASTTSIAWMVVDYHRSLRSFLPDKAKQGWGSSVIYFLWNLLLIAPRVAALALFASVLPGYIAIHFLLLWTVFVFWVWLQRTNFMDSTGGEWLYRGTVGLIWYFSWFNVAEGRTRARSIIYHSFVTMDAVILLVTWWSYRDPVQTRSYDMALIICLPLTYLLGLLFKSIYYSCFHPKLWRPPVVAADLPDAEVSFRNFSTQEGTLPAQLFNKRMASQASVFYSKQKAFRRTDLTNRTESNLWCRNGRTWFCRLIWLDCCLHAVQLINFTMATGHRTMELLKITIS